MYGCFLVPPDDSGATLGTLFWHKDGFSTACGHGTIALGAYAVDAGLVAAPDDGEVDVVIDVPSGRVTARVERVDGRTRSVAFRNVPAFVLGRGPYRCRPDGGEITVDLSYGGAIYASARAADVGLTVDPKHLTELIAIGREIRDALNAAGAARHPVDRRLDGVYGTIWYDEVAPETHQRNVHRLRRRRGGPLTVRLRHERPAGAAARRRGRRGRHGLAPRQHHRHDLPRRGSWPR